MVASIRGGLSRHHPLSWPLWARRSYARSLETFPHCVAKDWSMVFPLSFNYMDTSVPVRQTLCLEIMLLQSKISHWKLVSWSSQRKEAVAAGPMFPIAMTNPFNIHIQAIHDPRFYSSHSYQLKRSLYQGIVKYRRLTQWLYVWRIPPLKHTD